MFAKGRRRKTAHEFEQPGGRFRCSASYISQFTHFVLVNENTLSRSDHYTIQSTSLLFCMCAKALFMSRDLLDFCNLTHIRSRRDVIW